MTPTVPATTRTPEGATELLQDLFVPACEARWTRVEPGQIVQLIDVEGQQVGDFMVFRDGDRDEYLSPAHTCSCLTKLVPEVGDALYSNHRVPLLRVEADDVGSHDYVVPCCDPERYAVDYGLHDHGSCLTSLETGLHEFGVERTLRAELAANIFMNNVLTSDGRIETREPPHAAGSAIDLRVLEPLLIGLSACPQDLSPCNAFNPTSMAIRVWGAA